MSMLEKQQKLYNQYYEGNLSVPTLAQRLVYAEHQLEVKDMYISGLEAELAEVQKELHYALGKQIRLQAQIDSEEHY